MTKKEKGLKSLYLATFIDVFATGASLAFVWILAHAFMMAFFGPDGRVIIAVNEYGEAIFEFPLVIFVVIISTYFLLKQSKRNMRRFYAQKRKLLKPEPKPKKLRFIIDEPPAKPKNEQFQCPSCHGIFEVLPARKPALVTCPYCKLRGSIE